MTNAATLGSFGDVGGGPLVFRNKLINGDMSVFQRNAAVTANGYSVDRWIFNKSNGATESVSQNADAPSGSGFYFSLRNTISVGDASIGAAEFSFLGQPIEGINAASLAFGTSAAKSVTISFWIRSTVTGQYTGNISNDDASRICPFSYTIDAANTWEHKKVTLPGCLDGTWGTTNTSRMYFRLYSALGSSFLGGTSGVWNSAAQYGSGTPVNGISSNGNIFAITGLQLEAGTCATPFESLPIQTTLNLCYRYYQFLDFTSSGVACSVFDGVSPFKAATRLQFLTPMRIAPAVSVGTVTWYLIATTAWTSGAALTITNFNTAGAELIVQGTGSATSYQCVLFRYTAAASAEL